MRELVGNVLLLQIGKPSAITNVILSSLIKKALNYDCIEEIFGCLGGIRSLLNEQFIDLAAQQQKNISNLVGTPGAALKSIDCENIDTTKVADVLKKNNISYLFVIGDSSAIDFCKKLNLVIQKLGYEIKIILIPSAANNEMQLTDHCLSYGSMMKHLASMAKSIITDIRSTQPPGAITILELDNCENKWLISGLALAKLRKDTSEGPHLVILSNFDEGTFVKNVHQAIKNFGHCIIATGSKLTNIIGEKIEIQKSVAEHIKIIASANFDVQVDLISLRDWAVTSCMTLSGIDVEEAELCAQKALELAVAVGISGKMVTLLRTDAIKFSSEANCVDFENIVNSPKEFPKSWYLYEDMAMDVSFFKYAAPLIVGEIGCSYENGLPNFAKLR